MCGITGWIDWERELTGQRAVLEKMAQTLACRGSPGGSSLFAG